MELRLILISIFLLCSLVVSKENSKFALFTPENEDIIEQTIESTNIYDVLRQEVPNGSRIKIGSIALSGKNFFSYEHAMKRIIEKSLVQAGFAVSTGSFSGHRLLRWIFVEEVRILLNFQILY